MLNPPLNHRDITGVVKRAGECLKPLEHLRPFDAGDAKPFVTALQLEGVLSGDNTGAEPPAQAQLNLFGGTEDGQVNFAQEHGKNVLSCSTDPDSASCQKGLAMQNALMVALPAGLGGGLLAAATPEIATAGRVALQTCKGAFAICLNNIGIQVSETVVPGGVGAGGAIGIGKTVAEATTAKAEAVAANVAKVNQLQTSTVFDAIKGSQPV